MPRVSLCQIVLASLGFLALSSSPLHAQLVSTDFFNSALNQYSITNGALQGTLNASGASGLVGPSGVTVGPDNNIYYTGKGTDNTNNAVYKYTVTTGVVSVFITPAQLNTVAGGAYGPAALRFGPDNNLYIARSIGQTANPFTGAVDRFNGTTGSFITTVASGLSQPTGLTINGSDLYVSNLIGANANGYGQIDKISSFTTATPTVSNFIATNAGGLENPTGIVFGPDGKFYVADVSYSGNSAVRRYNADGSFTGANSSIISQPFQFTSDILFNNGKLITADLGNPSFSIPGGIFAYDATTYAFSSQLVAGTGFGSLALNSTPLVPEPASLLGLTLIGGLIVARRKR